MAKPKFQARMPRNGPEMLGSVKARVKFDRPTLTCQPWGRGCPSAPMNEPRELSAVQIRSVDASLMQSQVAS